MDDQPFRTLFESSPDAIFIEDSEGYVLDCNHAAAQLHDTVREKLIGRHVSELVPPDIRPQVVKYSSTGPSEFEGLSLTDTGASVPVSVRVARIQYRDKPALLLHVRDITEQLRLREKEAQERKRLEEEVRAVQKMEAFGRVAGGVAHDFNNLLTVILGRCEQLIHKTGGDPTMQKDLQLIYDSAKKAASVTRQLLAFGRKQVLQIQVFNLNDVIRSIETLLRSLIYENIEVHFDLDPIPLGIRLDGGQIEQVITNLVVNALYAMPNGGTLTVQTRRFEVTELPSDVNLWSNTGHCVVLSVGDTASGIDRETQTLSTVYGIIRQGGGHIAAQSEEQGTTFRIYLPEIALPSPPPENLPDEASSGNETILLVEDSDIVRNITREMLVGRGYKVIEARDGLEAINICRSYGGRIHLALSDVVMPRMNGRVFSEQAIAVRPGMKILLMSGYTAEILKDGLSNRDIHFIEKPFSSRDLSAKLRQLLDH